MVGEVAVCIASVDSFAPSLCFFPEDLALIVAPASTSISAEGSTRLSLAGESVAELPREEAVLGVLLPFSVAAGFLGFTMPLAVLLTDTDDLVLAILTVLPIPFLPVGSEEVGVTLLRLLATLTLVVTVLAVVLAGLALRPTGDRVGVFTTGDLAGDFGPFEDAALAKEAVDRRCSGVLASDAVLNELDASDVVLNVLSGLTPPVCTLRLADTLLPGLLLSSGTLRFVDAVLSGLASRGEGVSRTDDPVVAVEAVILVVVVPAELFRTVLARDLTLVTLAAVEDLVLSLPCSVTLPFPLEGWRCAAGPDVDFCSVEDAWAVDALLVRDDVTLADEFAGVSLLSGRDPFAAPLRVVARLAAVRALRTEAVSEVRDSRGRREEAADRKDWTDMESESSRARVLWATEARACGTDVGARRSSTGTSIS